MYYNLIEIKGYKRLSLNNVGFIRITPENKFHWVLGSNGSGKSSLIREITPLAAEHKQYHKGGYKLLLLSYKNASYKLLSDFREAKNTYSFIRIVDGVEEELNLGHTLTEYNKLVFQIFGINKDIHEFAQGRKKFTGLGSLDRKHWMTRLSTADYTYALGYFKRLTTIYRDRLGSVKTDHERLVEAKQYVISPEQVTALETRVVALKEQLHFLNSICPNPSTPRNQANEEFIKLQRKLMEDRAKQKKILTQSVEMFPLEAPETLSMREQQLTSRIEMLNEQKQSSFARMGEYKKTLDQHILVHTSDQKSVELSIIAKSAQIAEAESIAGDNLSPDPKGALNEFNAWIAELENMVPSLVRDLDGDLNPANYETYSTELQTCQRNLGQLDAYYAKLQKDLEDAKDCQHNPNITCPSCDHRWIPGYSDANIRKLETLLLENREKRKPIQVVHDEVLEFVTKYLAYKQGITYLNNLIWKYPNFKPFWDEVFYQKLTTEAPEEIRDLAYQFKHKLDAMALLEQLKAEQSELHQKLELLANSSVMNVRHIQEEHDRLEVFLDKIFNDLDELGNERNYIIRKSKLAVYLDSVRIQAEKDQKTLDDLFKLNFDHFQRDKLSDLMLTTNAELLSVEKQIRSVEIQQGQIDMLESNLEKTKVQVKALKTAVDALSPSTGLIAKGLTGFINHFIALVNSVIEKGWLYSMKLTPILPDENDNIDLDYSFPVKVKDEDVPDIGLCSSGQKEIIDLAIVVVGLAFMKMDHGTLFLDEFGANMDVAHKASAFEMISKLLVNSNFQQIFMISHFEGIHNRGLEADITVLCPANIQLPVGLDVNKVTEIA